MSNMFDDINDRLAQGEAAAEWVGDKVGQGQDLVDAGDRLFDPSNTSRAGDGGSAAPTAAAGPNYVAPTYQELVQQGFPVSDAQRLVYSYLEPIAKHQVSKSLVPIIAGLDPLTAVGLPPGTSVSSLSGNDAKIANQAVQIVAGLRFRTSPTQLVQWRSQFRASNPGVQASVSGPTAIPAVQAMNALKAAAVRVQTGQPAVAPTGILQTGADGAGTGTASSLPLWLQGWKGWAAAAGAAFGAWAMFTKRGKEWREDTFG